MNNKSFYSTYGYKSISLRLPLCSHWCHFIWQENNVSTFCTAVTTSTWQAPRQDILLICINHVTFETEVGITLRALQTHRDFDTSLFGKNITWHNRKDFFLCKWNGKDVNELGGTRFSTYCGHTDLVLEKITHQRSPHSWHTPWLSKACSLFPLPERGRGQRNREGTKEWESECEYTQKTHFQLQNQKIIQVYCLLQWKD